MLRTFVHDRFLLDTREVNLQVFLSVLREVDATDVQHCTRTTTIDEY